MAQKMVYTKCQVAKKKNSLRPYFAVTYIMQYYNYLHFFVFCSHQAIRGGGGEVPQQANESGNKIRVWQFNSISLLCFRLVLFFYISILLLPRYRIPGYILINEYLLKITVKKYGFCGRV